MESGPGIWESMGRLLGWKNDDEPSLRQLLGDLAEPPDPDDPWGVGIQDFGVKSDE